MEITNAKSVGSWLDVKKAAFNTIDKDTEKEPSSEWKRNMLLAEHSPIRRKKISMKIEGLKSWISVHLVRHKIGIEHFVSTRRTDRTGIDRNALRQDEQVNHMIDANAQAYITISRKRLCRQASQETRETWQNVVHELETIEPELASVCVPECVYRGFCPEFYPCGFSKTDEYEKQLREYRGDK